MFYRNTKHRFKLPDGSPPNIPGGIIAASAVHAPALMRRAFKNAPYLQHRLLDPQLYLSTLNAATCSKVVEKLATYPWFSDGRVPSYSTEEFGNVTSWKAKHSEELVSSWNGSLPTDDATISSRVESAINFQHELECTGIILPAPIIRRPGLDVPEMLRWTDAGLIAAKKAGTKLPTFSTIALTQNVLSSYNPNSNPNIENLADEVTAREADGVFLILEQSEEEQYSIKDTNTLGGILTLVDEMVQGGKRVIVSGLGAFGWVCVAAGAEIWSSDYYLSCRRMRLAEMVDRDGGSQYPRYFSPFLLGDIGVEKDLQRVVDAGLFSKVRFETPPAAPLHAAIDRGEAVAGVLPWQYTMTNVTAAGAHYLHAMNRLGRKLWSIEPAGRVAWVEGFLGQAEGRAQQLINSGISSSYMTELSHQKIWLQVLKQWMADRR